MKKSTVIALIWFVSAFITIFFFSSCSNGEEKISISNEDLSSVKEMKMNDNITLVRFSQKLPILDSDGDLVIAGVVYLRDKGMLERTDVYEEFVDFMISFYGEKRMRWIEFPLYVKSSSNPTSWIRKTGEILYTKDLPFNINRWENKTSITFDISEVWDILCDTVVASVYHEVDYSNDQFEINAGTAINFTDEAHLRVWGKIIDCKIYDNLLNFGPMEWPHHNWNKIKSYEDYLEEGGPLGATVSADYISDPASDSLPPYQYTWTYGSWIPLEGRSLPVIDSNR